MVTGCIHIVGAWELAVAVDCSTILARQMTATLFDMPPKAMHDSDIVDAIGELANMIGGNIKSLVPGPCQLSLPTVTIGFEGLSIPGTQVQARQAFICAGEALRVSVLRKDGGQLGVGAPAPYLRGRRTADVV